MENNTNRFSRLTPVFLPLWIALLAFFFANVEIQIEGANGWAGSLPTWRIEKGPLLDIFWGGRPLTGYHAWVFVFMALVFHLPIFIKGTFSLKLEARIMGSLMIFWIIEDFLWFILNPAFGFVKFNPSCIPWHKKWILGMPTDYPVFMIIGIILLWFSFSKWSSRKSD
jgi:hypothetical protein